jgi:hypothetical protein
MLIPSSRPEITMTQILKKIIGPNHDCSRESANLCYVVCELICEYTEKAYLNKVPVCIYDGWKVAALVSKHICFNTQIVALYYHSGR